MSRHRDDGVVVVVVMAKRIGVGEYLRLPETNRPQELVFGIVKEPPAPFYGHQQVVGELFLLLRTHVHERQLGDVCMAPVEVVLDEASALVVQPDLIFISNGRREIIRNQVWGAPDLVVEVASRATQYRDRTLKLVWYRKYGVRECWLVDAFGRTVEVVDCESDRRESFTGEATIRSRVLPDLALPANVCFA